MIKQGGIKTGSLNSGFFLGLVNKMPDIGRELANGDFAIVVINHFLKGAGATSAVHAVFAGAVLVDIVYPRRAGQGVQIVCYIRISEGVANTHIHI